MHKELKLIVCAIPENKYVPCPQTNSINTLHRVIPKNQGSLPPAQESIREHELPIAVPLS